MDDDVVKAHLHQKLSAAREALVWKHNAISDARYFGDVFDRPFTEPLPRWDDPAIFLSDHWATEHEARDEIVDLYRRVWAHSDATIEQLDLDARGYVPWWQEEVPLFNVMAARLVDAVRHAGHADILRESLDGAVGEGADGLPWHGLDRQFWDARAAIIERAARASGLSGSE